MNVIRIEGRVVYYVHNLDVKVYARSTFSLEENEYAI